MYSPMFFENLEDFQQNFNGSHISQPIVLKQEQKSGSVYHSIELIEHGTMESVFDELKKEAVRTEYFRGKDLDIDNTAFCLIHRKELENPTYQGGKIKEVAPNVYYVMYYVITAAGNENDVKDITPKIDMALEYNTEYWIKWVEKGFRFKAVTNDCLGYLAILLESLADFEDYQYLLEHINNEIEMNGPKVILESSYCDTMLISIQEANGRKNMTIKMILDGAHNMYDVSNKIHIWNREDAVMENMIAHIGNVFKNIDGKKMIGPPIEYEITFSGCAKWVRQHFKECAILDEDISEEYNYVIRNGQMEKAIYMEPAHNERQLYTNEFVKYLMGKNTDVESNYKYIDKNSGVEKDLYGIRDINEFPQKVRMRVKRAILTSDIGLINYETFVAYIESEENFIRFDLWGNPKVSKGTINTNHVIDGECWIAEMDDGTKWVYQIEHEKVELYPSYVVHESRPVAAYVVDANGVFPVYDKK